MTFELHELILKWRWEFENERQWGRDIGIEPSVPATVSRSPDTFEFHVNVVQDA